QHRGDDGHHHEGDLDEVEDEAQEEDHQHHHQGGAEHPAGDALEQAGHQLLPAKATEYQGKHRRADEDHEHNRGHLGGGGHHLPQAPEVELALGEGEHHGPRRPHARRLGGGGGAGQDRAQHGDDQQHRRQQGAEHRQQLPGTDAAGLPGGALGPEQGVAVDVEDVVQHQKQPGDDGGDEQVADGHRLGGEDTHLQLGLLVGGGEDVPQQHQHDRRGDDLAQGAGGADGAGGEARAVALLQHARQGHQPHGHHRGADDAGTGGQQHAHQDHRDAEPAPQGAAQAAHVAEQILRQLRLFQHHPHEHEQRHRDQGGVDDGAVDAVRQGVEEGHVEVAGDHAAGGERQGHATQGKRHRVAEHQQQAHGGEHVEGDEFGHHRGSTFSPTW